MLKIFLLVLLLFSVPACKHGGNGDAGSNFSNSQPAYKVVNVSPIVSVVKTEVLQKKQTNNRLIRMTIRNNTHYSIRQVRFKWQGIDNSGMPITAAISDSLNNGVLYLEQPLLPYHTITWQWYSFSSKIEKIQAVWADYVLFSDGGIWRKEN